MSIEALIDRRQPGFSLEQDFYLSPQVFQRDLERIYFRHWLFAGHVSRIPNPGDYFTYGIGGESIVLLRDPGGTIRGFYNVCRHRGSRLCTQEQGTAKKLICPYHAWTYDLDGRLLAARHMPDDFDPRGFGLHPCYVCVVQGLIFVSLADEPPPFAHVSADIDRFFAPHGWPEARICCRKRYVVQANWKLLVENFWECYHCPPAHPELASVMSYVHAIDSPRCAEQREHHTRRWEQRTRELGCLTGHVECDEGVCHQIGRIPIRDGFLTQSRGGKPVAPLMGEYTEYDGGVTSVQFFPFVWLVACNDHGLLPRFTPLTVDRTELEVSWLVRANAVEGEDYDVKEVTWMWARTIEEDVTITQNNQRGVESRRYRPGPYSKVEAPTEKLINWYLDQIR